MTRLSRQESNTGYYHVMTRGINKNKIFKSKPDKQKLIDIIREKLSEVDCKVYAYCVMDNHLHLLLNSSIENLSLFMKKINISYAMYYNWKNDRIGPVFQDRFRSENILNDRYFYGVIRYIHNNPVKANIVAKPEKYNWSSMSEYIGDEADIVHINGIKLIQNSFHTVSSFMKFHLIQDEHNYLEIEEEDELKNIQLSEKMIKDYLKEKNLKEIGELKDKEDLIIRLLKTEQYSYRKIAELVECSVYQVYASNKKNRP